jgi:RND family efflux transporter MFP subunit
MEHSKGGSARNDVFASAGVRDDVLRNTHWGFLALALCLFCAACGTDAPKGEPPPPPPKVTVMTLKSQTIPIVQDFVGTTQGNQDVDIRARVRGTLDRVLFKEGTLVKAGQVLFVLQKDTYEAAVQAAEAAVLKAKAQIYEAEQSVPVLQATALVAQNRARVGKQQLSVDRLTPLAAAHAVPQEDLDNATQNLAVTKADLVASLANLKSTQVGQKSSIDTAHAALLSAQSQLAVAKLNLSYCTIAAPVTGIIGFLKFDVGNVVGDADSQILDTISSINPLNVQFSADENTYLSLVGRSQTYNGAPLRDQQLTLLLSNGATFPYKGSLETVNRALDTKTGTIEVKASFPNPDNTLRPGQFGRVRIVTKVQSDAILIPQKAIVQYQGSTSALVVPTDGVVVQRSVTLGPISGDSYVITSGLRAGERVVVEGVQKAVPGKKVEIASTVTK